MGRLAVGRFIDLHETVHGGEQKLAWSAICLTVRQRVEAIQQPAEGEGSAVFVVFDDTRPHMMFKKTCFFFPLLSH